MCVIKTLCKAVLFMFWDRVARFNNVNHLSIHFPSNSGDDITRIYYIGLKGDFTEVCKLLPLTVSFLCDLLSLCPNAAFDWLIVNIHMLVL